MWYWMLSGEGDNNPSLSGEAANGLPHLIHFALRVMEFEPLRHGVLQKSLVLYHETPRALVAEPTQCLGAESNPQPRVAVILESLQYRVGNRQCHFLNAVPSVREVGDGDGDRMETGFGKQCEGESERL